MAAPARPHRYWGYALVNPSATTPSSPREYRGHPPRPRLRRLPRPHRQTGNLPPPRRPGNAGMNLTGSCAMTPAASVSGFYIGHPGAKYFAIPKIGRDQLDAWATRQGLTTKEAERWLAPLL